MDGLRLSLLRLSRSRAALLGLSLGLGLLSLHGLHLCLALLLDVLEELGDGHARLLGVLGQLALHHLNLLGRGLHPGRELERDGAGLSWLRALALALLLGRLLRRLLGRLLLFLLLLRRRRRRRLLWLLFVRHDESIQRGVALRQVKQQRIRVLASGATLVVGR